jgi:hypothetical protein
MSYELRRNVILELRLQVSKSKLIRLRVEVERFLSTYANKGISAEDVTKAAKDLEDVNNELQNIAPSLHE